MNFKASAPTGVSASPAPRRGVKLEGFRRLAKFPLLPLFLVAVVLAGGAFAQSLDDDGAAPKRSGRPPPRRQENLAAQKDHRFLFVVDTSSSMRADAASVRQSVVDLLKSDIQGQLREGDTIGLWNYDEEVHTEFPMQVWSPGSTALISERVATYLTDRQYRKKARLDKVLPYVQELIANSRVITVIFVYDGSQPMKGTPFDADINDLQKQFLKEVRSSGLPFVTILAARDGKPVEYTVNVPTAVTVPHTADPVKAPETNAPPIELTVVSNPPPAPLPAPPAHFEIVMSGRKNRTNTPAETSALAPAPTAPLTVVPQTNTPDANGASPATPQAAPLGQNDQQQPAPPQQVAETPAVPAQQAPVQAPPGVAPGPASATIPAPAVPSAVVTTTDGWNVISKPPVATVPAPSTGSLPTTNVAAMPPGASSPPPPSVVASVSQSSAAQSSVPPVQNDASSAKAPVPKTEAAPEPTSTANPVDASAAGRSATAAPVAAVTATTGDHIALLIIAISLLTIAVALVVFLFRRSRGGPQPSLISQSIDRSP